MSSQGEDPGPEESKLVAEKGGFFSFLESKEICEDDQDARTETWGVIDSVGFGNIFPSLEYITPNNVNKVYRVNQLGQIIPTTLLYEAVIRRKNKAAMWLVLHRKAKPQVFAKHNCPIFTVIDRKDLDLFKFFINTGTPELARSYHGPLRQTLLFTAAISGSFEIVKFILEQNNVNVDNGRLPESTTPLMAAVKAGHKKIAKYLIESGKANVFARDNGGMRASQWARKRPDLQELAEYLEEIEIAEQKPSTKSQSCTIL